MKTFNFSSFLLLGLALNLKIKKKIATVNVLLYQKKCIFLVVLIIVRTGKLHYDTGRMNVMAGEQRICLNAKLIIQKQQ